MGDFSIGSLAASLILDDTQFLAALEAANVTLGKFKTEAKITLGNLQSALNVVAAEFEVSMRTVATATDIVRRQLTALTAGGITAEEAIRTLNAQLNDLIRRETVMAEIEASVNEQIKIGIKVRKESIDASIIRANQEAKALEIMSARETEYTALWMRLLKEREVAAAGE